MFFYNGPDVKNNMVQSNGNQKRKRNLLPQSKFKRDERRRVQPEERNSKKGVKTRHHGDRRTAERFWIKSPMRFPKHSSGHRDAHHDRSAKGDEPRQETVHGLPDPKSAGISQSK